MHIIFRLILILIFLVLFSEFFVRAVLTLPVQTLPDAELGWVYKPYSSILHTSEGRTVNKINMMGNNDTDHGFSEDKAHILALGDSVTDALQVPQYENFTSIAEDIAPCLDVYNAG